MKIKLSAYSCGKHYLPNGKDGIDEITIESAKISTKDGGVMYSIRMLDGSTSVSNLEGVVLYESVECFKKGEIESTNCFNVFDALASAANTNLRNMFVINEDETATMLAYFFEDGVPVKRPISIDYITQTGMSFSAEFPEGAYLDYQDCLDWNDVAVNKDGEQYVAKGYKKHLALTKQQKEIINQMEGLKKQFIEAGGKFLFDEERVSLRAINALDIEEINEYWKTDKSSREEIKKCKRNFIESDGWYLGEDTNIADDAVYCNGCDKHLIIFKD